MAIVLKYLGHAQPRSGSANVAPFFLIVRSRVPGTTISLIGVESSRGINGTGRQVEFEQ